MTNTLNKNIDINQVEILERKIQNIRKLQRGLWIAGWVAVLVFFGYCAGILTYIELQSPNVDKQLAWIECGLWVIIGILTLINLIIIHDVACRRVKEIQEKIPEKSQEVISNAKE